MCVLECSDNIPQRGTQDNEGRWLIESLYQGDGNEDRNRLTMAGVVHGATLAGSSNQIYQAIDLDTVKFSVLGDGAVSILAFAVPDSFPSKRKTPTPVCSVPKRE